MPDVAASGGPTSRRAKRTLASAVSSSRPTIHQPELDVLGVRGCAAGPRRVRTASGR
jgi:hypothetical protein